MQLFTWAALVPLALAAPVIQQPSAQLIPGNYIIKLRDGSSERTLQDAIRHVKAGDAKHVYRAGRFRGFAAKLSRETLAAVSQLPDVEYIEQDAVVTAHAFVTQDDAPWGLGRISHRAAGATSYTYDDSAGEDTCSYILDTGIYVEHNDFEGRAEFLANTVDDDFTDGNGHGTHVAGTVGGATYGVAKKTRLFAVKVLTASGFGTWSGVVAGIDFVAADAARRTAAGECKKGAVANMSLGGARSTAVNEAVAAAVRSGVFFAVSAGNSNADAAGYSPASEPSACTVGASDVEDARAVFSNYGPGVDIFAPGVDVLSSWIGGPDATTSISGTSMSSPHIAGLGAYLLTLSGPRNPIELCEYIRATGTLGVITGLPNGTFNAVAFNGNPDGEVTARF